VSGEEQRGREPRQHQAHRVLPVAERLAEIAAGRAHDEARVLHGQGIVEAQALAELVHVLGLDVHRHEKQHGIAGQAAHREDRGEREEQDERRLAEAGHDVGPHGPTVVSLRGRGSWRAV
jgi:hypothetical protein